MSLQTQILHSVLASKNQVLTVDYLAKKYKVPAEYIVALAERNKDFVVTNGVVMAKREKALTAAFAGAGVVLLFGIVVLLPGLIG
ncbi:MULTISPECIES: hypothetical protein [Bacillus]|uniref:Uncharacterized protein n=2 Tax=Bacillus TaxID=1386 RepID=A0A0M4FQY7_9BACI|nr:MULTISPECIES: hypothetical protein [Bacillus]ALC81748.1 hypothetical protein AM592_09105 [Bacillus gobiensis]MBP1080828.1 hypothetical protein [Bacillus capparidis]MED1097472.1 hypothetical protein [Bacillus capparidis]